MAKSRDAFRTISEVSDWLDTPAHVLRFWESRFTQIKPVKRAGGRRYYRPSDMLLLGGIRRLLHDDGITIKGVQKILREKGVKYVASLCLESLRDDAAAVPAPAAETTPIDAILSETAVADDGVDAATFAEADDPGASADGDDRPSHAELAAFFAREIENGRATGAEAAASGDEEVPGDTPEEVPVETPDEGVPLPPVEAPFAPPPDSPQAPPQEIPDDPAPAEDDMSGPSRQVFVAPRRPEAAEPGADAAIRLHAFGTRPDAVDMGVDEIDDDLRTDRIVALYQRLKALRDRVSADMEQR
jgi:DNA-binding transcriptional MerR regulator